MGEKPILFKAPLVRAILAGEKTETRRIIKLPTLRRSDTRGFDWTWVLSFELLSNEECYG